MAERDRHREILRQFKHYLECKNIANMMYVLCMERRKCQAERETLEHAHRKEVLCLILNNLGFMSVKINLQFSVESLQSPF